jgi:transposase
MAFIRKIKKGNSVYLAKVENYRLDGKVKQRVIEYIGKEVDGKVVPKKTYHADFKISKVTQFLDLLTIDSVARSLDIPDYLGSNSKYLLAMIYSHLIKKSSLYKMPEWLERTEIANILKIKRLSVKDFYNSLEKYATVDFEIIQKMLATQFYDIEKDNKIAVLDITDTYFNGKDADWKSRRGKDGKYDKLIQIALAVTFNNGFPIMHKTYEGNISNIKIFEDMVNDLKLSGYDSIIVDRGMGSQKNITNLQEYGLKAIMGLRMTNKIADEYIKKIKRNDIFNKACQLELKNTKVYVKGFDYREGRLIAVYNPAIEISQREKDFEKDENSRKNKLFGYSLIYHNMDIPDKEAAKKYFEKDIVERSFKKIKGAINLHPFNASKLENIKTHIKLCYLAYAILSLMDYKLKALGINGVEALNALQGGYKVYIEYDDNNTVEKCVTIKKIQQQIVDALDVVYNC